MYGVGPVSRKKTILEFDYIVLTHVLILELDYIVLARFDI